MPDSITFTAEELMVIRQQAELAQLVVRDDWDVPMTPELQSARHAAEVKASALEKVVLMIDTLISFQAEAN